MRNLKILLLIAFVISIYACNSKSKKTEENENTDSLTMGYIKKSLNDFEHQKNTKVVFPGFILNIHEFNAYQDRDENGKLEYDGDSSDVELNIDKNHKGRITFKTTKDTLYIYSGGQTNNFYNNLLEIIPQHKNDSFKVYYAVKVNINDSTGVKWQGMTEYTPIKDSLNTFFRIPNSATDGTKVFEISKRLKLKDTLLKYIGNADYGVQIGNGVIYKGKPCHITTTDVVYLKIERSSNNQPKGINFLKVIDTYEK